MNKTPLRALTAGILALFLFCGAMVFGVIPATGADSGKQPDVADTIVFLTCRITADGVRLDSWTTAPGILKKPRSEPRDAGIRYRAVGASGTAVWQGSVVDPLVRRLEIEDPPGSSRWFTRFITRDSANVVIRLPAGLKADRIEFWKANRTVPTTTKSPSHDLIGSIPWPPPETK